MNDRLVKAKMYLELIEKWNKAENRVIVENINRILVSGRIAQKNRRSVRKYILMNLTGCSEYAIDSWFSNCRKDVKITLLNLCKIADYFHVDIEWLLTDNGKWEDEPKLSRQRVYIYTQVRQKMSCDSDKTDLKYFWDIEGFVRDMYIANGGNTESLEEDCKLYFSEVCGLCDGYLDEEIEEAVKYITMTRGKINE